MADFLIDVHYFHYLNLFVELYEKTSKSLCHYELGNL